MNLPLCGEIANQTELIIANLLPGLITNKQSEDSATDQIKMIELDLVT